MDILDDMGTSKLSAKVIPLRVYLIKSVKALEVSLKHSVKFLAKSLAHCSF